MAGLRQDATTANLFLLTFVTEVELSGCFYPFKQGLRYCFGTSFGVGFAHQGPSQGPSGEMINAEIETGKVEIEPEEMEVLNKSETPPFPLDTDGKEIGEENRMKYRYLDLRRERMTRNLRLRHKVIKFMRDYLDKEGFIEFETPIFTKSTPEGARDYVVPSRLYSENFMRYPNHPSNTSNSLWLAVRRNISKLLVVSVTRTQEEIASRNLLSLIWR